MKKLLIILFFICIIAIGYNSSSISKEIKPNNIYKHTITTNIEDTIKKHIINENINKIKPNYEGQETLNRDLQHFEDVPIDENIETLNKDKKDLR